MSRAFLTLAFALMIPLVSAIAVHTQPASPPPPEKYKVALRYDIPAPRDEHVALYKAMIGQLARIGFEFEPKLKPFPNTDYEDRGKNILTGFIAPDKVPACRNIPNVASLLLIPANYDLPVDPAQRVRVRLELAGGFPPAAQFTLASQVQALLGQIDFRESVGYDHRGYTGRPHTRLVGTIPAEHLETLLKDLRLQPTGWFMPRIDPATLPAPVGQVVPIVVTEVLPEPTPAQDAPRSPIRGQEYLNKITPDLWAMLISKDDDSKIVRAEIILSYVPPVGDEGYRAALLKDAPSLLIDGRLGPVVSGTMRVNQANALAGLPQVSVIRVARSAAGPVNASVSVAGDNARVLEISGVEALHTRGFKGQGVRIGIIDSDFRGYADLVASGKLPRNTLLVDLTTEYNPDVYPDPMPGEGEGDEKTIGHGTHCALAAALAAPQASLTLIRIDPTSLLQLQLVAKVVNGEPALDDHLVRRVDQMRATAQALTSRRDDIARERQIILNNFEDDSEPKRLYEVLGPVVRGWLFTSREWHYRRLAELDKDRDAFRRLEVRFQRFYEALQQLKALDIVCTSLTWNDGYPLGGGSPLSQWFDTHPHCKGLWFVAAGNSRGQTWTGQYRDSDGNGAMEFAAADSKRPPRTWSHELNFVAWQPHGTEETLELPEGARVRATMQWREPHEPTYFYNQGQPDRYLTPLAEVTLMVLRQRDPSGKVLPADDMEVVARSPVPAFRIQNEPSGSTYEQIVEFAAVKAGQYALRVERQLPSSWDLFLDEASGRPVLSERRGLAAIGIRPRGTPTLPALESQWEMRPRIFVSVNDSAQAAKGRVIFRDFATNQGSIPLLADTRSLIAVGAASSLNEPRPYSATGAPGTLWNFLKPNILAYDGLSLTPPGTGSAYGTSLATPFAAGMAAVLLSAGERPQVLRSDLQKGQSPIWRLRKS